MKKTLLLSLGLLTLVPGAFAMENKKPALKYMPSTMRWLSALGLAGAGIYTANTWYSGILSANEEIKGELAKTKKKLKKATKDIDILQGTTREFITNHIVDTCTTPDQVKKAMDNAGGIAYVHFYCKKDWNDAPKLFYNGIVHAKAEKACTTEHNSWIHTGNRDTSELLFQQYKACIDNFTQNFNKV